MTRPFTQALYRPVVPNIPYTYAFLAAAWLYLFNASPQPIPGRPSKLIDGSLLDNLFEARTSTTSGMQLLHTAGSNVAVELN